MGNNNHVLPVNLPRHRGNLRFKLVVPVPKLRKYCEIIFLSLEKKIKHIDNQLCNTSTPGFSEFSWRILDYRILVIQSFLHEENFMEISTTLSMVIWSSTGTLVMFATLVYVFTMRVVIYDIPSMAIITTLSTSILFCNLYYILLWISPCSVVKMAIRI